MDSFEDTTLNASQKVLESEFCRKQRATDFAGRTNIVQHCNDSLNINAGKNRKTKTKDKNHLYYYILEPVSVSLTRGIGS